MKITLVLLAVMCAPLVAHAAYTPFVQNVRFAQEISPTDLILPPQVLTHPPAAYTDEARRRRIQGTVIVQAYFDENGNASVVKVVHGLGYGLDENAVAALNGWRFSPALRDGLPVSAVAEIEVPFRLSDPEILRERLRQLRELQDTLNKVRQKQSDDSSKPPVK